MKFIISDRLPENSEFMPEQENWNSLKEPKNIFSSLFLSLPIGIAAAGLIFLLARLLGLNTELDYRTKIFIFDIKALLFLSIILVIPIHELIHALFFPESLSSSKVLFGYIPKAMTFYAYYDGEIKKSRFIISLLAPVVVISFIPLLLLFAINFDAPFIIYISALNALLSCADILGAIIILCQVPNGTVIKNKGIKSYWKQYIS